MRPADCCAVLLLFASAIPAFTQTVASNNEPSSHFFAPVTTISKVVDEVDLAFTVTDKRGHFIGNLQAEDFSLLDNHLAPQRLTLFQQRSDLPLHVAILMDTSSSVSYRISFEQEAATLFLKKVLRPGTDAAFMVGFNDKVTTMQAPTDHMRKISRAVRKIKGGGNTSLYDAVIYASNKLREMPERQITRRGIIVISDGVDTVNRSTLEQAKEAATRAEAMVFAISTNVSPFDTNAAGDDALRELAVSSGGVVVHGREDGDLQGAFHRVERALRNQYLIAYRPADFQADGSYRTLELVPHRSGLLTSYRKGYYAIVRQFRHPAAANLFSLDSLRNALH